MNKEFEAIPPKYVSFISVVMETARGFIRTEPQLQPVAFLMSYEDGKTKISTVGGKFVDIKDKDGFAEMVRQAASRYKAEAVIFISEAWTLSVGKDEDYETVRGDYKDLANHPRRQDSLVLNLETRDGFWSGVAPILQGKKGRKVGGVRWLKSEEAAGRFSNFLPVIYATPAEIDVYLEMARRKLKEAGIDGDRVIAKNSIISLIARIARHLPADSLTEARIEEFIKNLKPAHDAFYKGMQ